MTEDWQPGLTATKVQPPVPPRHLVHRSRLDADLDTGIPLVLVSVPAGSGQVHAAHDLARDQARGSGVLQVEASDSDPAGSGPTSSAPSDGPSPSSPTS